MEEQTSYEKDLLYIAKIDKLLSKKAEFLAYFVALVACLAAHVLYCVLFAMYGIKEMAIVNIGSIAFYLSSIILVIYVKDKLKLVYCALAEIILHASLATVFVGFRPDFVMFLLMIIPIAFLIPNQKKKVPFIIMGISLLLYNVLKWVDAWLPELRYDIESNHLATIFYVINAFIGVFVLAYVTTIYTIINRYQECKLRVQNEQLRIMASVDPLTKLSNRRAMGEDLKRIGNESEQTGESYVIGLGDIDNFKKINDTFGHDFGDIVLSQVAKMIKDNVPADCCVARWGGEEFLFVMPKASVKEGVETAERIVRFVRSYPFEKDGAPFFVTMTFGVATGFHLNEIDAVISAADEHMYYGKNHGKDQVVS